MKQQITIFFAISLVIFGLGYAAFHVLSSSDDEKHLDSDVTKYAPPPKPAAPPKSLVVKSVTGTATRSDAMSKSWVPVEPGNELLEDQKIRTEVNASVKLAVDEKSRIELAGESELSVGKLTDEVHQLHLEGGQMSVDYEPSSERKLKITSESSDAVASSESGRFVVQNAMGQVTVATKEGHVDLTAEDKTVVVGPNTISHVIPGKAPETPAPIPLKVMLRVANPKKLQQRERMTTIAGVTDVGAIVRINDKPVAVDSEGRFKADIPLQIGRNNVSVVSKTPWGSAEKAVPSITVTTEPAPPAKVDSAKVRWGGPSSKRPKTGGR